MADVVKIKTDSLTLDLLLWRKYGVAGLGMLEETIEANPGLHRTNRGGSLYLIFGSSVVIPDPPIRQERAVGSVIDLFA